MKYPDFKGFTLIECLVALVLVALIAGFSAGLASSALRAASSSQNLTEAGSILQNRLALELLKPLDYKKQAEKLLDQAGHKGWVLKVDRSPCSFQPELTSITIKLEGTGIRNSIHLTRWIRNDIESDF